MMCTETVSDIQFSILVHNMFSPCSAKRRASDKDLPVHYLFSLNIYFFYSHKKSAWSTTNWNLMSMLDPNFLNINQGYRLD